MQFQISDPSEIPHLLNLIHDRYIDADATEFDELTRVLRIPRIGAQRSRFLGIEKPDPARAEGFIEFHHVDRYSINDEARIRYYDVNVVRYDADRQMITLECGAPLEITAWVRQFDIRLTS